MVFNEDKILKTGVNSAAEKMKWLNFYKKQNPEKDVYCANGKVYMKK